MFQAIQRSKITAYRLNSMIVKVNFSLQPLQATEFQNIPFTKVSNSISHENIDCFPKKEKFSNTVQSKLERCYFRTWWCITKRLNTMI